MRYRVFTLVVLNFGIFVAISLGQLGNAGSIEGVVKDQSGGVVANATVELTYAVTGLTRTTATDSSGSFRFTNVPFNPYHMTVAASGFATQAQDVEVRSSVPITLEINVKLGTEATTVMVESSGGDLVEKDPSFHTDVDTALTQVRQ